MFLSQMTAAPCSAPLFVSGLIGFPVALLLPRWVSKLGYGVIVTLWLALYFGDVWRSGSTGYALVILIPFLVGMTAVSFFGWTIGIVSGSAVRRAFKWDQHLD